MSDSLALGTPPVRKGSDVIDWLNGPSPVSAPVALIVAAVLLVVALIAVVLWRVSRRRLSRALSEVETERDELELGLAEQTARLRIVGELHVVTLHSLSTMIGHADGVRYSAEQDPAAASRSGGTIADSARSIQADLRRVMTIIEDAGVDATPLTGLGSVTRVLAASRRSGLSISLTETGDRFDLVPGAELAVVRILEESLTNALEHGGQGTDVTVSLDWTAEGLRLQVDDDGFRARARNAGLDPNQVTRERAYDADEALSALTEEATGASMTEMRERASLFGGVFHAYPVPGVGFSVSTVFPALRYHNGVHGVKLDG